MSIRRPEGHEYMPTDRDLAPYGEDASNLACELEQSEARVKVLESALKKAICVCEMAYREWDSDQDMRVGKILKAMSGYLPKYRADIDEIHAAIAPFKVPPVGAK